ncbi:MAG: type pilus assembly protein PilB, partial [Patescibacteria group bacterium]|nr:type pilus assembly protein PilB [Patescibacteria group bacterium]
MQYDLPFSRSKKIFNTPGAKSIAFGTVIDINEKKRRKPTNTEFLVKPSEFSTGPSEGDSIPLEISPQNGEEISSSEGKRKRPIGEILAHSGLITRDQLAQALDQQARTGRKIGEILIANRWITEQSFQNALKDSGKKVRIGEILVEKKIIDEEQLEKALAYQKHNNKPLGESLLELGFVEEHALLSIVSRQLGIQYLDVSKDSFAIIDPDLREYLPDTDRAFWTGLKSLPIFFIESLDVKKGAPEDPEAPRGHLSVVMFDPLNRVALEKIEKTTRCIVNAYVCNANAIKEGIELLYSSKGRSIAGIDQADATKHTRYLNKLLYIATLRGASDIHIEPNESEVIIRMRVNGHMRRIDSISMDRLKTIVNVIKTSANLDISKRFVPQDGSFTRALGGHVVDVRVSTMPYIHGERCVLRVLLQDMSQKTLFDSNLPPRIERQLVQALSKKNGVILVTGPTGSGKTTTLHRALHQVASERTNVVTVEDPVEYRAGEYVNQSSINETRGFTYPVAIRSILRQDPDVILVGEIRDKETANIATEAALTGHLVLS